MKAKNTNKADVAPAQAGADPKCPLCLGKGYTTPHRSPCSCVRLAPARAGNWPQHWCRLCGKIYNASTGEEGMCPECAENHIAPAQADSCPECKEWREAIAALIESLPQPNRQLVCAKLATIPTIWEAMSPADRVQASIIVAKADEINLVQKAAPELLEALKDIAETPCGQEHAKQIARAAIAKAEGRMQ